jgi:hypothetical protein
LESVKPNRVHFFGLVPLEPVVSRKKILTSFTLIILKYISF